jgi:uncharacterized membrane protein
MQFKEPFTRTKNGKKEVKVLISRIDENREIKSHVTWKPYVEIEKTPKDEFYDKYPDFPAELHIDECYDVAKWLERKGI